MKTRYLILIEGKVQKGGFRSFIKKHALMLSVTGYAENLSSEEVIVVAEGEKDNIEDLIKIIEKDAPAFIRVDNLIKREEKYTGLFNDFERRGMDVLEGLEDKGVKEILLNIASYAKSTDEKLEKGIAILGDIKKDTSEMLKKQDLMLKKQDLMLKKQDLMLKKQDDMLKKQDESLKKQDEMLKKQDEGLKKQDKTISTIEREAEKTRTELGGKIDLLYGFERIR